MIYAVRATYQGQRAVTAYAEERTWKTSFGRIWKPTDLQVGIVAAAGKGWCPLDVLLSRLRDAEIEELASRVVNAIRAEEEHGHLKVFRNLNASTALICRVGNWRFEQSLAYVEQMVKDPQQMRQDLLSFGRHVVEQGGLEMRVTIA